jgi:hypothetical protein
MIFPSLQRGMELAVGTNLFVSQDVAAGSILPRVGAAPLLQNTGLRSKQKKQNVALMRRII